MKHAIKNFENRSSLVAIKHNRNSIDQFSFKPVTTQSAISCSKLTIETLE